MAEPRRIAALLLRNREGVRIYRMARPSPPLNAGDVVTFGDAPAWWRVKTVVGSDHSEFIEFSCVPYEELPDVAPVDPDRACPHEAFIANVDLGRLTNGEGGPVSSFVAEVRVRCRECGEPFCFLGLDGGMDPTRPMVSPDRTELRAPVIPATVLAQLEAL